MRRAERIVVEPFHVQQPLPQRRQSQKGRPRDHGNTLTCRTDYCKTTTRPQAQLGQDGTQLRCDAHCKDVFRVGLMLPKELKRNIELSTCRMTRQKPQDACNRLSLAGCREELGDRRIVLAGEYCGGQFENCARSARCIGAERVQIGHRLVVEIEPMRLEQIHEPLARWALLGQSLRHGGGNRISLCLAGALPQKYFAPPLQTNLAGHGLANQIAHARNLGVEGI
jgi:hypothetical protein